MALAVRCDVCGKASATDNEAYSAGWRKVSIATATPAPAEVTLDQLVFELGSGQYFRESA